jgi:hypothetical protein
MIERTLSPMLSIADAGGPMNATFACDASIKKQQQNGKHSATMPAAHVLGDQPVLAVSLHWRSK